MEKILKKILNPYGIAVRQISPRRNIFVLSSAKGQVTINAYREFGDHLTHKNGLLRPAFSGIPILCLRSEEVVQGTIMTGALMSSANVRASGVLPFGKQLIDIHILIQNIINNYGL